MKVVIQRHARDFCIYRLGAIAQAFAALKNEVQIECLEEFRRALALCPEIGWKNPHHPFEVAERRFIGEGGKDQVRPGGRRYDLVVNLDGDGLFEPRWASLGQPWWSWAKQEAKAALAMLPFISDWPEITAPLPAANVGKPYVLIATLSDECLASQINVNELDRFVRAKFPDCAVLWSAPKPLLIREGFATLVFGSYLELAAQIREARAVFAVNGMAGAIARSFLNGIPLAKQFWYLRGLPEERKAPQPNWRHPAPPAPGPMPKPDPLAAIRSLLSAPPNPSQGGILSFGPELTCTETQPALD